MKTHTGRCVAQLYIVCDTEKYDVHQRDREMDGFPNPLDIILQRSQTVCPWGGQVESWGQNSEGDWPMSFTFNSDFTGLSLAHFSASRDKTVTKQNVLDTLATVEVNPDNLAAAMTAVFPTLCHPTTEAPQRRGRTQAPPGSRRRAFILQAGPISSSSK